MSLTEEFKKAIRESVTEAILLERQAAAKQSPQVAETHSTLESIDNCPNCRGHYKADEFKAKILQDTWKDRKDLSMKCKKCGFPVRVKDRDGFTEETEDKDCPNCHTKDAEDRY